MTVLEEFIIELIGELLSELFVEDNHKIPKPLRIIILIIIYLIYSSIVILMGILAFINDNSTVKILLLLIALFLLFAEIVSVRRMIKKHNKFKK